MTEYSYTKKILVVDLNGSGICSHLNYLGIENQLVHAESNIDIAIEEFDDINPSLVIVSIESPQQEGMRMINCVRQKNATVAVIAVSHDRSPETSASAIRTGATDFLDLGLSDPAERLGRRIQRSIALIEDRRQLNRLEHPLFDEGENEFIGASKSMLEVSKLIINAAKSNASVFITGENGTGKEVCADLIHRYSLRQPHDLVTLNCAAIPNGLAESEMFGHVKGSFTGAVVDRQGVARQAHEGTLFLDEIGEMEMDIQSKLLRFVQSGIFNKVGSGQQEQVDVRFICATNRDPLRQIDDGSFRQDLFYRLNVIQIHLPPLRERGEDIILFARKFLNAFAREENKQFQKFSPESEQLLLSYSWPGNVRELQNVIRSIVVLHEGDVVIPSMLPLAVIREKGERRRRRSDYDDNTNMIDKLRENVRLLSDVPQTNFNNDIQSGPADIRPLDDVIEETIKQAINLCQGNVAEASHHLGVSTSTLYRKLKS